MGGHVNKQNKSHTHPLTSVPLSTLPSQDIWELEFKPRTPHSARLLLWTPARVVCRWVQLLGVVLMAGQRGTIIAGQACTPYNSHPLTPATLYKSCVLPAVCAAVQLLHERQTTGGLLQCGPDQCMNFLG